jgi:hypothetical protein
MKIWRGKRATGIRPWLLSLLCVLASVAYLTRQTEAGRMNMGDTQMVVSPLAPMQMDTAQTETNTAQMEAGQMNSMPMSSVQLGQQPPCAPHSPAHNHSGHCPFCFTAAFALVAETSRVDVLTTAPSITPLPLYVLPDIQTARHAEARAPPLA